MSDTFEDRPPSGEGTPTRDETTATRDYLKRHNRKFSLAKVKAELEANGFQISRATVQRHLEGKPGGNPAAVKSPVQPAEKRLGRKRAEKKRVKPVQQPLISDDVVKKLVFEIAPRMAQLLDKENSSTQLAIDENRTRMALNIILGETLAANTSLVLLDMRGGAALIDALTVAAKLSGGASIDISIPAGARDKPAASLNGGNGHMIDVTPQAPTLIDDLSKFRQERAAERRGERA